MKVKALVRSQFLVSGLVYALGLGSFFAAELLISRMAVDAEVAEWAALKSSLFIGASVCMLGLDQALIRNPANAGRIARFLAAQALIIAGLLTLLYSVLGSFTQLALDYLALVALTGAVLISAFYRSRFRMIESQSAANHWRLSFGILVAVCFLLKIPRQYPILLITSVVLGLTVSLAIYRFRSPVKRKHLPDTENGLAAYYRIGARFCLSALFLNLSLNVEQLILKANSHVEEAATYFRYTTLFLMPAVAVTGFLGFYLGPFTRLHGDRVRQFVLQRKGAIFAGAAIAAIAGIVPGLFAFPYIFGPDVKMESAFTICMGGIAFFRLLNVLPSAYLGVYASGAMLDRYLFCSAAGLVALVAVYYALSGAGVRSDIAVAIASLSNWAIRTSAGLILTYLIIQKFTSTHNESYA